jgi:hypothetical protein
MDIICVLVLLLEFGSVLLFQVAICLIESSILVAKDEIALFLLHVVSIISLFGAYRQFVAITWPYQKCERNAARRIESRAGLGTPAIESKGSNRICD